MVTVSPNALVVATSCPSSLYPKKSIHRVPQCAAAWIQMFDLFEPEVVVLVELAEDRDLPVGE